MLRVVRRDKTFAISDFIMSRELFKTIDIDKKLFGVIYIIFCFFDVLNLGRVYEFKVRIRIFDIKLDLFIAELILLNMSPIYAVYGL